MSKILRSFVIGSIGLGAALGCAAAHAETLIVNWTESAAGISASWEQSSTPTPISFVNGSFTDVPISDFTSTGATLVGPFTDILWIHGGLFDTPDLAFVYDGPQAYSGEESAPVFLTGTFQGTEVRTGADATVTISAVPETSTWAMLLFGFTALGFAGYRGPRRLRPELRRLATLKNAMRRIEPVDELRPPSFDNCSSH
jgi:hypothetical protein